MLTNVICNGAQYQRYEIIDTQFKEVVSIEESILLGIDSISERNVFVADFIMENIYLTYLLRGKGCPFRNLLIWLTKIKPYNLTSSILTQTAFYKKHISFFQKHYPLLESDRLLKNGQFGSYLTYTNNTFGWSTTTTTATNIILTSRVWR